jgi:predicted enzyme related to lactoylglutathione lyase
MSGDRGAVRGHSRRGPGGRTPGNGLVTLMVDELDERIATLNGRGIATGDVEWINDGVRALQVTDPDGNRIQLGEVSSAG